MSNQEICLDCGTIRSRERCAVCEMLQCIERGDKNGFLATLELECEQNPISDEELSLWMGIKRPEKIESDEL